VWSRLCGFLGLLEPDRKSVSVRTILKPSWPVDQCSGDPLQPKFEWTIMDFEQPIGDVNLVIRVDADYVVVEGGVMDLRLTAGHSRRSAVRIARPHP
jgi:hypothetical protein